MTSTRVNEWGLQRRTALVVAGAAGEAHLTPHLFDLERRVQLLQRNPGQVVDLGAVLERHAALAQPVGHRLLGESK